MKVFDGLHAFFWTSMAANNCNTYLIDGPAKILIDPGHLRLFDRVTAELRGLGLELSDIDLVLVTHAHPDHFEAVRLFKDLPASFALSVEDWKMIEEIGKYAPSFDIKAYTPDFFLDAGNLDVKGTSLQVIPTPGHSRGSVSLYWADKKALFTGDVIFRNGLGRTDLQGGHGESLKESIRNLGTLDAEWLLPGHGDMVSGKAQVASNFREVETHWFGYI